MTLLTLVCRSTWVFEGQTLINRVTLTASPSFAHSENHQLQISYSAKIASFSDFSHIIRALFVNGVVDFLIPQMFANEFLHELKSRQFILVNFEFGNSHLGQF